MQTSIWIEKCFIAFHLQQTRRIVMLRKIKSSLQKGFTLIELPIAIAIIGVLEVTVAQLVTINAVRVATPPALGVQPANCVATLALMGSNGTVLSQKPFAMGDGSVQTLQWKSNLTEPVYAVISGGIIPGASTTGLPSPLPPACIRNGEVFATMEVLDTISGETKVLPGRQLLPAVQ